MFDCRRLNWWTVLLFFFAPNLPWPTGSLHLLARISQWTTTFLLVLLGATSARNPNSLGASKRLQDRSMTTVVKFPTDTDKPLQRRKKCYHHQCCRVAFLVCQFGEGRHGGVKQSPPANCDYTENMHEFFASHHKSRKLEPSNARIFAIVLLNFQ